MELPEKFIAVLMAFLVIVILTISHKGFSLEKQLGSIKTEAIQRGYAESTLGVFKWKDNNKQVKEIK
jgi:hypothetical protein